jgi:hypothetical protein
VYFVEKSGYENSCYDPVQNIMSDDPTCGISILTRLLSRFDLQERWCYVDAAGKYHGLPRKRVEALLSSADLFCDMGTHGNWLDEAAHCSTRVLIDGEPAFTQMKMENRADAGEVVPQYDYYYTTGRNIGTDASSAPTGGIAWRWVFHPVVVDLFPSRPAERNACFTTVMNWQSYEPVRYRSRTYGHKDVEFEKFVELPQKTPETMELAVSGKSVPHGRLEEAGWRLRDAHEVTVSFDSFAEYIARSKGEFSICKSGYVVTSSGWFSDRSAAYLASARPVVMQETGFSSHLPCGDGLFAVKTAEQAAAALEEINADYDRHCRRARDIAGEYLDTNKVLLRFLSELGL